MFNTNILIHFGCSIAHPFLTMRCSTSSFGTISLIVNNVELFAITSKDLMKHCPFCRCQDVGYQMFICKTDKNSTKLMCPVDSRSTKIKVITHNGWDSDNDMVSLLQFTDNYSGEARNRYGFCTISKSGL